MLIGVPRVFEKIEEKLTEMGRKASPAQKLVVDWAKRTATAHHVANMGREVQSSWKMQLARKLIFQ